MNEFSHCLLCLGLGVLCLWIYASVCVYIFALIINLALGLECEHPVRWVFTS